MNIFCWRVPKYSEHGPKIFMASILFSILATVVLLKATPFDGLAMVVMMLPIAITILFCIANLLVSGLTYFVTEGEKEVPWGYFSQYLLPKSERVEYLTSSSTHHQYTPLLAFMFLSSLLSFVIAVIVGFPIFMATAAIICGTIYGLLITGRKVYKLSQRVTAHESDADAHKVE